MRTRYRKIVAAAALSALASMAILASAAEATPPPAPYQDFAGCPGPSESQEVAYCNKYEFTGGHVQVGRRNIPITSPILFRGGAEYITGNFLGNSEAGLTPVRQTVEGGLVGQTGNKKFDEALAASKANRVYATLESAGTPGQLSTYPLELPIKIHLENPLLGSSCYIGSNANPIKLNLTTGTTTPPPPNQPITGQESTEFESEAARPEVLYSHDGIFVDNSFAAPATTGCVLTYKGRSYNIDQVVSKLFGLPSAAGRNTAVLNFNLSLVSQSTAYQGA